MNGSNSHLNLFRFYNQTHETHIIENNLSRAFAICLRHDPLLLYAFLDAIDQKDLIKDQLMSRDYENGFTVDLQNNVETLPASEYVFPVAMTSDDLDVYDFDERESPAKQITDITIQYGNALIIIEAKRHSADCIDQLHNQVAVYKKVYPEAIVQKTQSYSWKRVLRLFEMVANLQSQMQQPTLYANAFREFVQSYRPEWTPMRPLAHLPFSHTGHTPEYNEIMARLKFVQMQAYGDEVIQYPDRIAMPVNVHWASEVITKPQKLEEDNQPYIAVYIWPGNTKGQGYSLFNLPQSWLNETKLDVGSSTYKLIVEPYIKFTHISGKFIFDIKFTDELSKYVTDVFNKEIFFELAGMWKREKWPELEVLLDELTENNWRADHQQVWQDEFIDSGRSFVSLALGYELRALIPYKEAQQLDKSEKDWQPLAGKFKEIINAFVNLVEGRTVTNALKSAAEDINSKVSKEA